MNIIPALTVLWSAARRRREEQHERERRAREAVLARVEVCGRCYGNKTIASRNPLAGEGPDICPRCHGRGVVEEGT